MIRLEGEDDTLAKDSKYPDILGKGYSAFLDDGKAKYYEIENDTALTYCNSNAADIWNDFNGDDLEDNIYQWDDHFLFTVRNPISVFQAITEPVYGTFLGTIDINGDGTSAYVY